MGVARVMFPTFGPPFVKRFALFYRTLSVLYCPLLSVCLPVCDVGVLWQTVGWIKMKLGMPYAGRPRPWPHYVRWEPSSPPPKGHSPQFSGHICSGQVAGWIKTPLGREVGLGPRDAVLDGDPAPLSKKGLYFRPMSTAAKRLDGSRCHLVWR